MTWRKRIEVLDSSGTILVPVQTEGPVHSSTLDVAIGDRNPETIQLRMVWTGFLGAAAWVTACGLPSDWVFGRTFAFAWARDW